MTFALMGKFICSALFFFLSGAQLHRCFNIILSIPTFLSFCSGTSSSGSIVSSAVSSALPSLLCHHRLLLSPFHFSKMLFSSRIFIWFSFPSLFKGLSLWWDFFPFILSALFQVSTMRVTVAVPVDVWDYLGISLPWLSYLFRWLRFSFLRHTPSLLMVLISSFLQRLDDSSCQQ